VAVFDWILLLKVVPMIRDFSFASNA